MTKPRIRGVGRLIDGYTIIEVVIFLAISGSMLLAASILINGRQQRTLFTQSVVDFQGQIQDISNDVSTGYYPGDDNVNCTVSGGIAKASYSGGNEQGSNSDCVFVGKLIHFYPDDFGSDGGLFKVYTIFGPKNYSTNPIVPSQLSILGRYNNKGIAELDKLKGGLKLTGSLGNPQVFNVRNDGTASQHHSILFVSASDSSGASGAGAASATRVDMYALINGWVSSSNGNFTSGATFRPIQDSIVICLGQDGSSTERRAALFISPELKVTTVVDNIPSRCR